MSTILLHQKSPTSQQRPALSGLGTWLQQHPCLLLNSSIPPENPWYTPFGSHPNNQSEEEA